ncbi:hypothetical protein MJO28_007042 [Puccinia striiformis f. sp. tritici]|uniref:Uncharacterized protein n=1 Tax=Puccinia striiformis f. sp. tritici TaxID=168172 RepID=A0ACC0EEJ2_9BASI|nr:hypothetical protein MJO28_007042 [Puccinia striiformis f. sp. tritici]
MPPKAPKRQHIGRFHPGIGSQPVHTGRLSTQRVHARKSSRHSDAGSVDHGPRPQRPGAKVIRMLWIYPTDNLKARKPPQASSKSRRSILDTRIRQWKQIR